MRFVLIGPPGAGKSTVVRLLAEATGGCVAEEDPSGFAYFDDAMSEPTRHTVLSQVEFMLDKARIELAPASDTLWQHDDTRYCHRAWTPALARAGWIDRREAGLLDTLGSVLELSCPQPAGIVSLELGRPELERRLIARGQPHEVVAGKLRNSFHRLLRALHEEHRHYVRSASAGPAPMWSVDASGAPEEVSRRVLARASGAF